LKTIAILLLVSSVVHGAEPPDWVLKYAEISRQYRYEDLQNLRSRSLRTKEHRALVKKVQDPLEPHYCPLHGEQNRIGSLAPEWYSPAVSYSIHVEQVVDGDSIVARLEIMEKWPRGAISVEFPTYWIDGIPTDGMVDDRPIEVPNDVIFVEQGSKTYVTVAGGSRTIYKARAYPLAEAKKFAGLFCVGGEARSWSKADGTKVVDGSLSAYRRGEITIAAADGTTTKAPLKSLSKLDREFVRDVLQWEKLEKTKRARD
jgi:hypothetical protein